MDSDRECGQPNGRGGVRERSFTHLRYRLVGGRRALESLHWQRRTAWDAVICHRTIMHRARMLPTFGNGFNKIHLEMRGIGDFSA